MKARSSTLLTLVAALQGCSDGAVSSKRLTFVERPTTQTEPVVLIAEVTDDGFGSSVAASADAVWIGAPHGETGIVYRWDEKGLERATSGPGRLGAHIVHTGERLLVSAPMDNRVVDQSGREVRSGLPSMGIALSVQGDIAWAEGWIGQDGSEETTAGRPTSLFVSAGQTAVGFSHGEVAMRAGDRDFQRPQPQDEAGFSLSSSVIDEQEAWLLGAPGAGRVYAISKADFSVLRTWSGEGRFGHAILTNDVNGDGHDDLVVSSPFHHSGPQITWFDRLEEEGREVVLGGTGGLEAGLSLAANDERLIIGAPGQPDVLGKVFVLPLPLQQ